MTVPLSAEEFVLDNGLKVVFVPAPAAPVATLFVVYRVGARNEAVGYTGSSHLLEHMLFKGTPANNRRVGRAFADVMNEIGAAKNATTWIDRTNYFETVPSGYLDLAIEMEADRMRNAFIADADRRSEMTVVRNEFERRANNPDQVLTEEVSSAAYVALPYHHPIIGWRSDIEHVPIAKLREFYDTFYWPNNATVTVVGDIDPAAALGLIKKYYGSYPHSPQPIPDIYTEEPAQSGPRRVTIKRPGEIGSVIIAHKVSDGRAADQPALEMLDAILSSGKSARLYHALVDQGIALNADSGTDRRHDLSLHLMSASLAPGVSHEQVETALSDEMEKIRQHGVTPAEIERVKQQYIAADAYRRDGTAGVAAEINEWIAVGDWTLYVTFPESVAKVTPADVQRVAKQYFKDDESTIGWFVPVAPQTEKGS